ncbi:MAG: hypothetical protein EPN34_12350 [Burkholderiaceae bacterium]|nr:MAG: hypothetical protein EPN34_12350 [Burkholderiaceae bacterium]
MHNQHAARAAGKRAPDARYQPALIYIGPDDGSGIETGIRKALPGPSYSEPTHALAAAVFALDSGRHADAIGATCISGVAS